MIAAILVTIAIVLAMVVAAVAMRRKRRAEPLHVHVEGLAGPLDVYDREWDDGRPVRVLATGTTLQSAVYLDRHPYDPVFEYYVLYDLMFEAARPVRRVLMMGGGGYGYPRYLLHVHPEVRLDVVELDHAVTRLAERYFGLAELEEEVGLAPRGRLGLLNGDARAFLEDGASRYDAILNDCFSGRVPAPALATVEAARAVHARLEPQGIYLSNVVSALRGPKAALLRSLVKTYGQVFAHVYVVPCGRNRPDQSDNNMLVATDAPIDLPVTRQINFSEADPLITDADNPTEELARGW